MKLVNQYRRILKQLEEISDNANFPQPFRNDALELYCYIINEPYERKQRGRPRLIKPDNFNAVYDEWFRGEIRGCEAWVKMGISKASFYRLVKELNRKE